MRETNINYVDIGRWVDAYRTAQNEKVRSQLKHLIVVSCMPLVRMIAYGLARRSTDPIDDLIQCGCLGIVKAVKGFSPSRGCNFRAYAIKLVTGEIRHYLRDKCAMIRAPREIQGLAFRIHQITEELSLRTGRTPTDVEIAEFLQTDIESVHEVYDIERRKQLISLDQVNSIADEEFSAFSDTIADAKEENMRNVYELRNVLKFAIEELDEEAKKIVELHYFEDVPQSIIASELGLTRMQVSRKLKYALRKMFNIIKKTEETN